MEQNREAFRKMLQWLHSDPDAAGAKYEQIRDRLIFIFRCRGCVFPDELADECIDRVSRLCFAEGFAYTGDPALFFYGVGKVILKEHFRARPQVISIPAIESPEDKEDQYRCLEKCMSQLSPRSRQLILDYYGHSQDSKIADRKSLAQRLGIPLNALRIQTCRIRTLLKDCALRCFESQIR